MAAPDAHPSPHAPPRADTPRFLGTPHGGGGAEARRARDREERSSLPRWAARELGKKLFAPAPGAWSPARAAPRGWELHLRLGARSGPDTGGTLGRGGRLRASGCRFPSASSLPAAWVVRLPAPGAPSSVSHQPWLDALLPPPAGEGVTRGGGRGAAGSPCGRHRPPPPHARARSVAGAVTGHPWPVEGAQRAALRGSRRGIIPWDFSAPRAAAVNARETSSPREGPARGRPPLLGAGRHPLLPLHDLAPAPRLLLRANSSTALLLYPPLVGGRPELPPSPSLPPIC